MSKNELVPKKDDGQLSLDPSQGSIDISHLPKETQDKLREYAATKQIDLAAAAAQTGTDLQTTANAVGNMATVTRRMTESGDSVTVRQTIDNTAGKTEVLMGNTDEAKRGNVDKQNNTWIYIVGGIVVLIVLASFLGNQ